MNNNWLYKGRELTPEDIPKDAYGYTYIIKCTYPKLYKGESLKGKYYMGKKALTHTKRKRVAKKVIKTTKTRKRIVKEQVDSGWNNYYGSSKELNEIRKVVGNQYFEREIIEFHKNKAWLSYAELKLIACSDALLDEKCFNKWVSFRGYGINLKK